MSNTKVLSINGSPIKVNGNYVTIADTNLQDKVITPTAEPQVVMADEQYIGLNSVMIMSDDALVPENIKEGTSIFGVEGTYKATDVAFAIADGNTAPDTPSENMMWVQTDTEVSTFSIRSSIERPTDPTEGMVWVVNGQTSSGSFDILADENSLIVYPQKAYQYINGEWTARPIKIYKNGVWTDLFTATLNITYPEGALCECTDGVIVYTAPDRTGIWELIVPNPGTWITSGTEGEWEIVPVETVIETNGENQNIELEYFEAFITVTYPSGTCTCTCGSISYTHSGGGTTTFTVYKTGTWTVKANNGTNANASNTVVLSTSGENKSITLKYTKTITVNLSASAYDNDGYQDTDLDVFATKQDLSAYNTIKFTVTSRKWTEGMGLTAYSWIRLGISSSASSAPTKYVTLNGTGATTATLDISDISSGYISAYCSANASYTNTGKGTAAVTVSTVILNS